MLEFFNSLFENIALWFSDSALWVLFISGFLSATLLPGGSEASLVAALSLDQYKHAEISLQDLLQIVTNQKETELKFLDVYLGYRRALLDLKVITYFDFEKNVSLLDELKSKS